MCRLSIVTVMFNRKLFCIFFFLFVFACAVFDYENFAVSKKDFGKSNNKSA